jgi:hypothetical protein
MAACSKYTLYKCTIGRVYSLHAAMWPHVKNTRGHLFCLYYKPRCHQDIWLVARVSTVIGTVDTQPIASFFVV